VLINNLCILFMCVQCVALINRFAPTVFEYIAKALVSMFIAMYGLFAYMTLRFNNYVNWLISFVC